MTIGLALTLVTIAALQPQVQEGKAGAPQHRAVVSLSADARAQIAARVLAHPNLPQRARGHRLAAIRVTAEEMVYSGAGAKTVATVVLFDHTALEARRILIDPVTNQLLLNEPLTGRPQRSDAERDEAIAIIRRDRALARLLDEGGVLDGGFIVDDPRGSRRRAIEFKLTTGDRRALLRSIVVDLTAGEVALFTGAGGDASGRR